MNREPEPEAAIGKKSLDGSTVFTPLECEIISYWVQVAMQLSYPRSVGEIFGVIFISSEPVNADYLVMRLGISRSGAGQGLKVLMEIGAVQPIHTIADRRDHYQMQSDLGVLVRQFLNVRIFPQLEDLRRQRESLSASVAVKGDEHLRQRFDKLQRWQKKAAPLITLLKALTV